jgi:hypothetical protein
MKGIYNVEQVLAECCVLASFSVIQKYKRNYREHCPLAVVAQIGIKVAGICFEIIKKSKCQYDNAPNAYAHKLQMLFFMEKPEDKSNRQHIYSAFTENAANCDYECQNNIQNFFVALPYIFQTPDKCKQECKG